MKPPRRTRVRGRAAIIALLLIAPACSRDRGGDPPEAGSAITTGRTGEAQPVKGGTLTIGLEGESRGWQPCVDPAANGAGMRAIYDTLMRTGDDGKPYPYLAASLTPDESLTEWTLRLRPNVKFHDGTPLDAAAVRANFLAGTEPASICAGSLKQIRDAQIVDPLTVKYVLDAPYGAFPELLMFDFGMVFSPTNAAAKGDDVSAHPVGAGPFVFKSWVRDAELVLERNPDYWQEDLPRLDHVILKPIPDEDVRLASLVSGQTDLMVTLRSEYVKRVRELDDGYKRYERSGNNSGAMIFNVTKPPVDDKRIRRALAHSMVQTDLIKIVGGEGVSEPSTQFFSKDSQWYSEKVAAAYPKHDVAKGKALVDAYMKDSGRSDGKPVGSPVEVTFNCPPDPTLITLGQAFQQMAATVGIEVEFVAVDQATHFSNAAGDPPYTAANYMINCWRLGGDDDPDTTLFNEYGAPRGQAANVTNYDNPEVQAQLKIGRESADFATRYAAYERIGLIFNEDVPQLWSGSTTSVIATESHVAGVSRYALPEGDATAGDVDDTLSYAHLWVAR